MHSWARLLFSNSAHGFQIPVEHLLSLPAPRIPTPHHSTQSGSARVFCTAQQYSKVRGATIQQAAAQAMARRIQAISLYRPVAATLAYLGLPAAALGQPWLQRSSTSGTGPGSSPPPWWPDAQAAMAPSYIPFAIRPFVSHFLPPLCFSPLVRSFTPLSTPSGFSPSFTPWRYHFCTL